MRRRRSTEDVDSGAGRGALKNHVVVAAMLLAATWGVWQARAQAQSSQTWVRCASSQGFCRFSGTKQVRIGSAGRYYSRQVRAINGGISCLSTAFGDEVPSDAKYCDILVDTTSDAALAIAPPDTWEKVARQGFAFVVDGAREARYGANDCWVSKTVSGLAACTSEFFGANPIRGVDKACWVAPASPTVALVDPPPSTWKKIASEGQSYTLVGTQPVRYGSGLTWIEAEVTDSGTCSNEFFGNDPLVGVYKECWAPAQVPTATDYHPADYQTLAFQDEFSGDSLDRTKWCTRFVYGGGPTPQVPDPECQRNNEGTLDFLNDEQQRYVDYNRLGEPLHRVQNGVLSLIATRTRTDDSWAKYESAMIRTKQTFVPSTNVSYYITARVRLPNVKGSWPAFWMAADYTPANRLDWPPEIDVFEAPVNGVEDTEFMLHQSTVVRGGKQTATGKRSITFSAPEYETTWGNYFDSETLRGVWVETGLEWNNAGVCYYIDGYRTVCEDYKWITDSGAESGPATLMLNLAMGGSWAGRYGVDDARLPTQVEVDYIRIYKK